MEVGQGPNWGCSAKEKNSFIHGLFNVKVFTSNYMAFNGNVTGEL
jgi:hypothetical protein